MSAYLKGAIGAVMLAGSAVSGAGVSVADEVRTFKPMHAISVQAGTKHGVGYFETVSGVCELTLVVGEQPKAEEVLDITPARFRASVRAGQRVRFDTGEGQELAFYCGPAAGAMSVETLQQTAYKAVR